jgi:PAS domain S-box-containing protein
VDYLSKRGGEFTERLPRVLKEAVTRHHASTTGSMAASAEASALFRQMADSAPVMVWGSGPDGGCTYFNQPWLEFTGRALEEELGDRWADGVHPEDLARCLAVYQGALAARQPFAMEYRLRRYDGAYRCILDKGAPRLAPDGSLLGYLGCCTDITEVRQALEVSREQDAMLQAIFHSLSSHVVVIDAQGTITFASRAWDDFFRANAPVAKGVDAPAMNHAGIGANYLAVCEKAAGEGGEPRAREALDGIRAVLSGDRDRFEMQYPCPSPWESRWFLMQVSAMPLGHGGAVISHTEITAIKQAEYERLSAIEAMRESLALLGASEERNRAILAAVPDLLFVQDSDGTYRDYYARDPGMLLAPPEAFLGRNMRDLLPPGLAEVFLEKFDDAFQRDEPSVLEYVLPIGGEERHYEARMVRCNVDQVLSVVRDVTDRWNTVEALRQSEAALRQSEAALRRSNRRSRDLAGQLILAQEEERRRISRELHDNLNQKVALLALAVNRIRRARPGRPHDPDLDAALDELRARAAELSEDVRRLSHDLHPPALEYAGLGAALEAHCAEFSQATGVRVALAADLGGDHGDNMTNALPSDIALCLYRIAQEALGNVARHARANRVEVALQVAEGAAHLRVTDRGKGFDYEETRRHNRGLGLRSMEERVRQFEGEIAFDATPGRGTELRVMLPLRTADSG